MHTVHTSTVCYELPLTEVWEQLDRSSWKARQETIAVTACTGRSSITVVHHTLEGLFRASMDRMISFRSVEL